MTVNIVMKYRGVIVIVNSVTMDKHYVLPIKSYPVWTRATDWRVI